MFREINRPQAKFWNRNCLVSWCIYAWLVLNNFALDGQLCKDERAFAACESWGLCSVADFRHVALAWAAEISWSETTDFFRFTEPTIKLEIMFTGGDKSSFICYAPVTENLFLSVGIKEPWMPNSPGGRLNKKDGLTRYGDSHVKDKTS